MVDVLVLLPLKFMLKKLSPTSEKGLLSSCRLNAIAFLRLVHIKNFKLLNSLIFIFIVKALNLFLQINKFLTSFFKLSLSLVFYLEYHSTRIIR